MSDLSQGNLAKIVLKPGDVYRVTTAGVATVLGLTGAPATTTTATAQSQDFGPYNVDAVIKVTATTGPCSVVKLSPQNLTATAGAADPATAFAVAGVPMVRDFISPVTVGSVPTKSARGVTLNRREDLGALVTYEGGFLTSAAGQAGARYWYLEEPSSAPITRMGVQFKFDAGSTGPNGAVVMIPWATSIVTDYPTVTVPRTSCHFVISRYGWKVQKYTVNNGSVTTIASGGFNATLTAGAIYTAEVFLDTVLGNAYLLLPDGKTATIVDSTFSSIPGYFACFEYFQLNGDVDDRPLIGNCWFDTGDQILKMPAGLAAARHQTQAPRAAATITSVSSTSVPTTFGLLDSTAVVAAPYGGSDKRVLCKARVWMTVAASRTIIMGFKFIDSLTSAVIFSDQFITLSSPATGWVNYVDLEYVRDLSTATTPLIAQFWYNTSGAGDTITVSATRPLVMSVTPLG